MANLIKFSPISEISSQKTFWNLKGKVIRLWCVSDFNKSTLPFSIEMVLVDDAGNKIHASIKKTLLYKFKNEIFEGKCYSFENLGVAINGGSYRTTRHGYKLNFQFSSKVQYLPNLKIISSPYNLIPISEIVGGSFDFDYLTDTIGVISGVGTERELERNGSTTKLNVIELEAEGHKIQCTLFGSYVDELNSFIASGENQNAIVIVQLAKAKTFQDKIHLQNCLNCTKLVFNPTCPDGISFRNRLAEIVDTPSPVALTQLQPEQRVEPRDEFLLNTQRGTMQGLKDSSIDSVYVVIGKIERIVNQENFWYTACICSKAVIPDSQMFFCEKCDKHVKKVFPKYCLKIRAIDLTDCATLIIFDKECSSLFNKSCADMISQHEQAIFDGQLPPLMHALIGQTYLFKVETKANFSPRFERSFRVKKICVDPVVINEFKQKWDREEASFAKHANESASLSVLLDKGKRQMIEGSSSILSHDLLPKFKGVASDPVEKLEGRVVAEISGVVTQDLLPKFKGAASEPDLEDITPKVADSSTKRDSPTKEDEDMNMPLKLIRRSVKIEKL